MSGYDLGHSIRVIKMQPLLITKGIRTLQIVSAWGIINLKIKYCCSYLPSIVILMK